MKRLGKIRHNSPDSNEYTQYIIFNTENKISRSYSKFAAMFFFSKGLENELETVVVNEPSVFEPLKIYCTNRDKRRFQVCEYGSVPLGLLGNIGITGC